MIPIRTAPDPTGRVVIGRYKEQLVREVAFPVPEAPEGGHWQVVLQRPHDDTPYPVACRMDGDALVWLVQLADTSDPGEGLAEIRWDGPGGETWKSTRYSVRICAGLSDPTEAPEAWTGFMQQVSRDAGRAEAAAEKAEGLREDFEFARDTAVSSANAAREAREAAAKSAGEAKAEARRAETAADRAEQGLTEKGWMFVEGESDGHLYLYTNNLEDTTLEDDNGRLIAVYGSD